MQIRQIFDLRPTQLAPSSKQIFMFLKGLLGGLLQTMFRGNKPIGDY
jgi:hypothetical protein